MRLKTPRCSRQFRLRRNNLDDRWHAGCTHPSRPRWRRRAPYGPWINKIMRRAWNLQEPGTTFNFPLTEPR